MKINLTGELWVAKNTCVLATLSELVKEKMGEDYFVTRVDEIKQDEYSEVEYTYDIFVAKKEEQKEGARNEN